MPEHGLTDDVLNTTDVLIWWGHIAHSKVSDEAAEKVKDKFEGMDDSLRKHTYIKD